MCVGGGGVTILSSCVCYSVAFMLLQKYDPLGSIQSGTIPQWPISIGVDFGDLEDL